MLASRTIRFDRVRDYCLSLAGAVEDLSRQAIRDQFETNLFGWLELTNLFERIVWLTRGVVKNRMRLADEAIPAAA
mgnify:CR=1 FL=1